MRHEIYFFVRDDDLTELNEKFMNFYRALESLEIPVIYGIIPGKAEKQLFSFLRKEIKIRKRMIHLAQHGWMHANYGSEKKYEFGDSRSYEEQKRDIIKGLQIMEKQLDFSEKRIFIPPYNNLNNTTLDILKELKFNSISTNLAKLSISGIKNLPALIGFEKYSQKGSYKLSLKELLSEFQSYSKKFSLFGIYIHDKNLSNEDLEVLTRFLTILKNTKIKFI